MSSIASPRTHEPAQRTTRACAVVASLTRAPSAGGDELRVPGDLEVRADLVGELDPAFLRARAPRLIYSLRSEAAGGSFSGDSGARRHRLLAAAAHYDTIDLEADRDLTPDILAAIPPHRRRISWHGGGGDLSELRAQFARMAATPAQLYMLATAARSPEDALAPLQLLAELRRSDVTAFGTTAAGVWSRLVAPWLGAPVVFGGVHRGDDAVPTLDEVIDHYRVPSLAPFTRLFAVVGRSLVNSMWSYLHNAGYSALGVPAFYLPIATDDFARSWPALVDGLRALGFSLDGATVVNPHKEAALALAETISDTAQSARAANLLVRRGDGWHAHTTDGDAVVEALRGAGVPLAGRRAAVIGCGGAGRAIALALARAGLDPVLVNRGAERGRSAASFLGLPYRPLAELAPEDYSLVVHATPLRDRAPFAVERLRAGAVVLDMCFGREETALVAEARAHGHVVVDGSTVLIVEAANQFRRMTGRSLPAHIARKDSHS